jgi:hypothetical protein
MFWLSFVSLRGVNDATGGFRLLLQSSFTDCLLQPRSNFFGIHIPMPVLLNTGGRLLMRGRVVTKRALNSPSRRRVRLHQLSFCH